MNLKKKENIILIGGGGHCKSVIDVIESAGLFQIAGIIDIKENIGKKVLNYEIIGTDDDLPTLIKSYQNYHIAVGHIKSNKNRIALYDKVKLLNGNFPVIISFTAYVSKHAEIGAGTIIMHHAIVNAGAKIGCNTIINTKAMVEHDAVIGNHCHISTGAIINGGVEVGDNTFFGSGAVSKQYIKIPENSFIKANSVVKVESQDEK
ncbi:MAG: acetyltransferase [Bacteroidia bacterium]|nr:acetyltransferase [Bacteroidia bacterium]